MKNTSIMLQVSDMVDSLSLRLSDSIIAGREGNYFGSEVVADEVSARLEEDLDFFGKSSFYDLYKMIIREKAIKIADECWCTA